MAPSSPSRNLSLHRRRLKLLGVWSVFATALVAAQAVPADLAALAAKARVAAPVAAWCRADFRGGYPGEYAAALSSAGGGRYVVVHEDASVVDLAAYAARPDLSCYTATEARKLHTTIRQSDTIEGEIVPRWETAVVCGFLDDTSSACWQYSPDTRTFVRVGGWTT